MRTPRVVHPGVLQEGEVVSLEPAESRHLLRVLRRGPGDLVVLLGPEGAAYEGEILGTGPPPDPVLRVLVRKELSTDPPPPAPWTLGLALLRGDAFDLAIRLAVELNLARLVPLLTQRCVVRLTGPEAARKRERWLRLAQEAQKQCGRVVPLEIDLPFSLRELVSRPPAGEERWICIPGAEPPAPAAPPGRRLALVGPEGGFSPAEVEEALAAGCRPVGFPTPVLRAPTAVALLCSLAAFQGGGGAPPGGGAGSGPPDSGGDSR